MLIPRLSEIDMIYSYEKDFLCKVGVKPYNISSWKVSSQFREQMLRYIDPPSFGNIIDYVYTYSLPKDIQQAVLRKLGVGDIEDAAILFSPNNTTSIVSAANLLKANGCQKVCIVNPAYFSVAQAFCAMGLEHGFELMIRQNSNYFLPYDEIISKGYDAVWITSPIFATGRYFPESEIKKIRALLERGVFVVADESFALPGKELIRHLGVSDHFAGIYSPHKSISCNNLKFSALVTSDDYDDFLEQWADVLTGNLPQSSCSAILHFISPNYDNCLEHFSRMMGETYTAVQPFLHGKNLDIDREPLGCMFTLYFGNIPNSIARSKEFYANLYQNTFAGILPGYLNGFSEESGLCFRVNMALDGIEFRHALQRLIPYLDSL